MTGKWVVLCFSLPLRISLTYFEQGELKESSTVRKIRTIQKEGKRMVNRTLTYYNLDVIISVGFRVNTTKGIELSQWANMVLKD